MQRLLLELYIQNGLHGYFFISGDIEKGDFITANVIKLSKINNIGFYLATGKALFLMKYFFSYE